MRNFWILAVIILSGCGGGSSSHTTPIVDNGGQLYVSCADVTQGQSNCQPTASAGWLISSANAAIQVDGGVIQRWIDSTTLGAPVIHVNITNSTASTQTAYFEIAMSGSCGSPETPRNAAGDMILFGYPDKERLVMAPGATGTFSGSNMCSILEAGDHTITVTVWDADKTTVIDFALVNFTLVD